MKSARRLARELALKGLYQWLVGGHDLAAVEAHLPEMEGHGRADRALLQRLLRGTVAEAPALRAQLAPLLDRPVDALSPIEHAILLLAAWELQAHLEAPYKVVINEAIELAKEYGGTDGHKYVNGVLDKLAPVLRPLEARAGSRRAPRASEPAG
jgi:N utilization substance protein B